MNPYVILCNKSTEGSSFARHVCITTSAHFVYLCRLTFSDTLGIDIVIAGVVL